MSDPHPHNPPIDDPHPDSPPVDDPDPNAPLDPQDLKKRLHQSDEHRLDEGLEETFPASDSVSAKHIT